MHRLKIQEEVTVSVVLVKENLILDLGFCNCCFK